MDPDSERFTDPKPKPLLDALLGGGAHRTIIGDPARFTRPEDVQAMNAGYAPPALARAVFCPDCPHVRHDGECGGIEAEGGAFFTRCECGVVDPRTAFYGRVAWWCAVAVLVILGIAAVCR